MAKELIKVKFLKDHVNGIKSGDVGEFDHGRATYLINIGAAELTKEGKTATKKVEDKSKVKKCKTC